MPRAQIPAGQICFTFSGATVFTGDWAHVSTDEEGGVFGATLGIWKRKRKVMTPSVLRYSISCGYSGCGGLHYTSAGYGSGGIMKSGFMELEFQQVVFRIHV